VTPAYAVPRTPSGQPSLEGIWTQNFLILMEASPQAPMLTLPEPAAKAMAAQVAKGIGGGFDKQLDPEVPELMAQTDGLPIVRGERRTRSVVEPADGKLPYTEAARKESNKGYGGGGYGDPEERPNWERCITSLGLPPVTGLYTTSANPRQIVQTPGAVVIHTEYGDEARIIPLTATHKPAELTSSLGDPIAHWEGDTLVVDTTHLKPATILNNGLNHSDKMRVHERFKLSADGRMLLAMQEYADPETLLNRGARFIAWTRVANDHVHGYECDPSFAENYAK
jgi:hypothetical protein